MQSFRQPFYKPAMGKFSPRPCQILVFHMPFLEITALIENSSASMIVDFCTSTIMSRRFVFFGYLNTVPAPIKGAASIQKLFNIRIAQISVKRTYLSYFFRCG